MTHTPVMGIVLLVIFGVGLVLILWFVIALSVALLRPVAGRSSPRSVVDPDVDADGMNPGDYYNGPHGYSPMTGYPETQYGSGFDPDAEWNHERE